jgi:hypothetical protein
MTHDEAHELLPAYALDAVAKREREDVEAHLSTCPRCAAELSALRDVAAALGNSVEPVQEGVWSAISSRLVVPDHAELPPPHLKIFSDGTVSHSPVEGSHKAPRSRTGRRYLMVVTSVAAAAVAATAVLGLNLARTSDQNDRLQAQLGTNNSSIVAALETPGHTLVNLRAANRAKVAQIVLLPSGRGYLVSSSLPKLKADQTYQLWGVFGGQATSLGLLGSAPNQAAFTVAGGAVPSQLGVTVEPPSGSVVPSTAMVASGPAQA